MDQPDDRAKARLKASEALLGRRLPDLLVSADQRADPEQPLAAIQRCRDRVQDPVQAGKRHRAGPDRLAPGRLLAQLRNRHVAIQREHQGARNRRRGHEQEIGAPALGGEIQSLVHAEAMLLVDDRQSQIGKGDIALEQGMSADRDPGRAARQLVEPASTPSAALAPGEQKRGEAGRSQQRSQTARVLTGQNLGRRHDRRLAAGFDRSQHGEGGDQRLAAADIALQEAEHPHRLCHVALDLGEHPSLPGGKVKGQSAEHRPTQPAIARERAPGLPGGGAAHHRQRQMVGKQLVVGKPLTGRRVERELSGAHGLVEAAQGFAEARPPPALEPGPVLPFGQFGQPFESASRDPPEQPLAQSLGQQVDRLQRRRSGELGRGQDQLGMDDLPVAAKARQPAADHPPRALGQRVPQIRLAHSKEDQIEGTGLGLATNAIRLLEEAAPAATQVGSRLVLFDQHFEGHALALARSRGARPQSAVDDRVRQVPEQIEAAGSNAFGQTEQSPEGGLEARPNSLQTARWREQRSDGIGAGK